ncbi:MAG: NTP transferase domain-containing protein [Spirochaetes bacterium]|nr:NTP transferase domain-containing protein [Spirochaetota bacterium]
MTRVVILAGGKGCRLAPYTTVIPKPLMPLGDRPILDVVLRQLKRYDLTDITIAVGHLADLIVAYCGDGGRYGVRIGYTERETTPLGTAGSLSVVPGLTSTFLVMNGDLLTTLDYGELLAFHKAQQACATISVCERDAQISHGVIEIDAANRVSAYVEKPTFHYHVSMGIYVFEPEVLSLIPAGCPYDVPDLVKELLSRGRRVAAYRFDGYWQDIGRLDDSQRAVEDFENSPSEFLRADSLA